MKGLPAVIDENGDIQVHGRQGCVITLQFSNEDGTPENVSAKTMTFECGSGLDVVLTNGGASNEKVLTLSNANIKSIYNSKSREFVILDSSGAQPTPRWIGTVYITGWVE